MKEWKGKSMGRRRVFTDFLCTVVVGLKDSSPEERSRGNDCCLLKTCEY